MHVLSFIYEQTFDLDLKIYSNRHGFVRANSVRETVAPPNMCVFTAYISVTIGLILIKLGGGVGTWVQWNIQCINFISQVAKRNQLLPGIESIEMEKAQPVSTRQLRCRRVRSASVDIIK